MTAGEKRNACGGLKLLMPRFFSGLYEMHEVAVAKVVRGHSCPLHASDLFLVQRRKGIEKGRVSRASLPSVGIGGLWI